MTVVGILSKNSPQWVIFDIACSKLGITTFGLYQDNSIDWLEKTINKAVLRYICCSSEYLTSLLALKQSGCIPTVELILCLQKPKHEALHVLAQLGNVRIVYYREKCEKLSEFVESNMEKIYTLALTSGVTGDQRMCMISHSNLLMSIYGANIPGLNLATKDVYISYVTLSLLWERVIMYKVILAGASVGFSDRNNEILQENIQLLKPTLVLGVPQLIEEIYDKIQMSIFELSTTKKSFFQKAYLSKLKTYKKSKKLTSSILDKLIFKPIRDKVGGKVRFMITGSAMYRPGVVEFLRIVLSCEIIEGYGSTETAITCLCSMPGDNTSGHVGGPLAGYMAKLRKLNGVSIEGHEGKIVGELYLKGEKLFKGYYKGPEQCLNQDGWLATGDILAYNPSNASFTYIDIQSCLITLSNNKTISLQKLETLYKTSPLVKQILIKHKNDKLIALIVPNEAYIKNTLAPGNVKFSEICQSSLVVSTILNDLNRIAKNMDLKHYEKINKILLEPIAWETDDVLAPTLKLRRPVIESRYSEIVEILSLEPKF